MRGSRPKSFVQPFKLANRQGELAFNWLVKDFSRLSSFLAADEGKISVTITAFYDANKRCLLNTQIVTELKLTCQTSFAEVNYPIDKQVIYCPLQSEAEFAQIDQAFEPVLLEDDFLDMQQIVEDELILSLPLILNKPADELKQKMVFGELPDSVTEKSAKPSPFAVLSDWKKSD